MIKNRLAGTAALVTFGLAALGGAVVTVAAPANAAPASSDTSSSASSPTSGTTPTSDSKQMTPSLLSKVLEQNGYYNFQLTLKPEESPASASTAAPTSKVGSTPTSSVGSSGGALTSAAYTASPAATTTTAADAPTADIDEGVVDCPIRHDNPTQAPISKPITLVFVAPPSATQLIFVPPIP